MKRLPGIVAAAVVALGILVPTALAADPMPHDGRVLISFNGGLDVPAGQHADAVLVVNGDARIAGDVNTIVVLGGNAILSGARSETVLVADGSVTLDATTVVLGDVRTLSATVLRADGAVVQGSIRGLDAEIAGLGFILAPAFLLLFLGVALLSLAAGLVVAALAGRQVRAAEALISHEPVVTFATGIVGAVLLPLAAVLAIVTLVGAPIGVALLFVALPAVAYLGWIVAAIWIGDWILAHVRGATEPERPYRAAVVGIVLLAALGGFPPISAIASLFGFGAVLLLAWRILRHEPVGPRPLTGAPIVSTGG